MVVPTCAKCNKPVSAVKVYADKLGIHFVASCHGSVEIVSVPPEYLKNTQDVATIEIIGKAFDNKDKNQ